VPHLVDPHWPGDVLELLFAGILEGDIELASRIFLHPARNADPTRFREALQTRRHIHAVAVDVAAVDDDIADIDPNTELDPLVLRRVGIAPKHAALYLDGTAQRIDHARELSQHAVAGSLDDPSLVFLDLGIEQRMAVSLQLGKRALFVGARQPAIASNVGRQNCRKPTLHALASHGTPLSSVRRTLHASGCEGHEAKQSQSITTGIHRRRARPLMAHHDIWLHCKNRSFDPLRTFNDVEAAAH
jgi:hypothetical protein